MPASKTLRNKVQLITYPDSLGGNLVELHYFLRRHLTEAVGALHLLPFYPSSADRGFAPLAYDRVDPAFGTWEDVERIGADFDLMVDFMVNHISRQSIFFQDYLEKGARSEFADMFFTFAKLSPGGEPREEDLAKVYTRKPRPPYTVIERSDGSKEKIWCTFDYEQIDLDWWSPKTREVMRRFLFQLARRKVRMIRLDAVAYTTVQLGTDCFFVEPAIWELLELLRGYAAAFGTQVLPEVHEHHDYQLRLAARGYWTYDFALPMLVLHTLYHHSQRNLLHWLRICPRRQLTTLDTHDGIGVIDVVGLMEEGEIRRTIDGLYAKGSNVKRIHSSAAYRNLDIYQVNCTYFSALEGNPDAYLAARTIQFFTPGIPQVYYVGLLAGENDLALVERTRNGRDLNRHNYSLEEAEDALRAPVVQRLLALMRFRNAYPAFEGELTIGETPEDRLELTWRQGPHEATARIDLRDYATRIVYRDTESGDLREMAV
jgi:sucrose phosphorylase